MVPPYRFQKIELTQRLVDALDFDKQPFKRPDGNITWRHTPPTVTDWMVGDTTTPGLLLRLTPHAIAWVIRRKLNGVTIRRSLGTARSGMGTGEVLTLAQARKRAEQWRGLMASGRDPLDLHREALSERDTRKRIETATMGVAYVEYMNARRKKNSQSTAKDRLAVHKWMATSPLWKVPVVKLTRADVAASLGPLLERALEREQVEAQCEQEGVEPEERARRIGSIKKRVSWGPIMPGSLDRIYMYSRQAWERAAADLHLPPGMQTPFSAWRQDVKWPQAKRRTHWLDTNQDTGQQWVRAIVVKWKEAHTDAAAATRPWHTALLDYYICVLLWGTRLTETTLLKWAQVDEERKVIWLAPETTKTQILGCVPLTPWASEILAERKRLNQAWQPVSPYVFPSRVYGKHIVSPQKTLAAINEAAGFAISTHDLRRTLATDIAGEKHPLEASSMLIAGAALQHAQRGGVASATTEGYVLNRAEILRPIFEKREARLRRIADLKPLGKPAAANRSSDIANQALGDPEVLKQIFAGLASRKQ